MIGYKENFAGINLTNDYYCSERACSEAQHTLLLATIVIHVYKYKCGSTKYTLWKGR